MRKTLIALGGATLLLGALVPATFAAAPVTFSYTDHYVVQHECGITETVDVSVDGKAFFDSDGTWLRDLLPVALPVLVRGTGWRISDPDGTKRGAHTDGRARSAARGSSSAGMAWAGGSTMSAGWSSIQRGRVHALRNPESAAIQ